MPSKALPPREAMYQVRTAWRDVRAATPADQRSGLGRCETARLLYAQGPEGAR